MVAKTWVCHRSWFRLNNSKQNLVTMSDFHVQQQAQVNNSSFKEENTKKDRLPDLRNELFWPSKSNLLFCIRWSSYHLVLEWSSYICRSNEGLHWWQDQGCWWWKRIGLEQRNQGIECDFNFMSIIVVLTWNISTFLLMREMDSFLVLTKILVLEAFWIF